MSTARVRHRGIKRLTQSLPVVLAVFMGDAPQVFKIIENRINYSPIISRWGTWSGGGIG